MIEHSMIQEMSDAFGPPGFEQDVTDVVRAHMKDFDVQEDYMHNLYIGHPGNQGNRLVVQLDAHLDEVGFMVQAIQANGTISIVPMGGWVASSVPSQPFLIKNKKGDLIRGIVVSKPPHFKTAQEKANEKVLLEDLTLDVGCTNRSEVVDGLGIAPGDPIAPEVRSEINTSTGIIFGKAFDNRLGCVAIMEIMKRLKDEDLPVDLVAALAVQEEVGMRGATVTAQTIQPDFALIFEGSPADDLYFDQDTRQCALKAGAQIRHFDASYISHRGFIDFAQKQADEQTIKTQHAVRRGGSTNAGKISLTGKAVPCLVLGIPSRFIHTHYNFASMEDLEAVVNLACSVLKNFNEEEIILGK